MINATEFVILTLASGQAIEIWRHGAIMAPFRMRVDIGVPPPLVPQPLHASAVELLKCPFCLSVWVAAIVYLAQHISGVLIFNNDTQGLARNVGIFLGDMLRVPILALAISRAANLINDLTYPYSRTPGRQRTDETFDPEDNAQ